MRSNFTDAAGLGKGPVSMEPYRSAAYFEMERDKVFARTWLIMGRTEDVANVGDRFAEETVFCFVRDKVASVARPLLGGGAQGLGVGELGLDSGEVDRDTGRRGVGRVGGRRVWRRRRAFVAVLLMYVVGSR